MIYRISKALSVDIQEYRNCINFNLLSIFSLGLEQSVYKCVELYIIVWEE